MNMLANDTMKMTHDGWVILEEEYAKDTPDEVGGDAQMGAASMARVLFLDPEQGRVVAFTYYVYPVAYSDEDGMIEWAEDAEGEDVRWAVEGQGTFEGWPSLADYLAAPDEPWEHDMDYDHEAGGPMWLRDKEHALTVARACAADMAESAHIYIGPSYAF